MGKIFPVYVLYTLFCSIQLSAQTASCKFKPIPIPDQLVGNFSTYIIREDAEGAIWIGTESGLIRFDGYESTVIAFDSTLANASEPVAINNLEFDKEGNLWIVASNKGLYKLNRNAVYIQKVHDLPEEFNQANLRQIKLDGLGRLWLGSKSNGTLLIFDPATRKSTFLPLDPTDLASSGKTVYALAYDTLQKEIWVALSHNMIYRVSESSLQVIQKYELPETVFLEAFHRTNMKFSPENELWVTPLASGMYCISPKTGAIRHYKHTPGQAFPQNDNLRDFTFDKNGKLYVIVNDIGLDIFDLKTQELETIEIGEDALGNTNLEYLFSFCLYLSRQNILWIGSTEGVAVSNTLHQKIDHFNFSVWRGNRKVPCTINSILSAGNHKMWIGTHGNGIFEYDTESKTYKPHPGLPPETWNSKTIMNLFRDKKGSIWCSTLTDGLYKITDAGGKPVITRPDGASPGLNVYEITEDQDGHIWGACVDQGVIKYDSDGKKLGQYFPSASLKKALNPRNMRAINITSDQTGNIWVGYLFGGVGLIKRGVDTLQLFSPQVNSGRGLPSGRIRDIFVDSHNHVWVCFYNMGIAVWTNDHFQVFNNQNGLEVNNIKSIVEDSSGNLWLASPSGVLIYQYTGGALKFVRHIPITNGHNLNYSTAAFDESGNYYAGGTKGMFRIEKNYLNNPPAVPQTKVSDVFCYGEQGLYSNRLLYQDLLQRGKICPPSGCQSIFLDVSSTIIQEPESVQFAYLLENSNVKDWTTLEFGQRRIAMANLAEGSYTLKIKSRVGHMQWGPEYTCMVVISVPFWKSRLFIVSLIVSIGGLAFLYFFKEIQKRNILLKQQQMHLETVNLLAQNEALKSTVSEKTEALAKKSAEIAFKSSQFEEIKTHLDNLKKSGDQEKGRILRQLSHLFESDGQRAEGEWEKFQFYFDQSNQNFTKMLIREFPDLTPNDIRLAILIRLNLSTKEIGQILNIEQVSVQKSKYRLKKHLGLSPTDNLVSFILQYNPEA